MIHVIKENVINTSKAQKTLHLLEGVCFQLHFYPCPFCMQTIDGILQGLDFVFCHEVVVFDHCTIIQTHSVILASSCNNGPFL